MAQDSEMLNLNLEPKEPIHVDVKSTGKLADQKTQLTIQSNFNDDLVNTLPRDELSKIQNTWELPTNLKVDKNANHENQSEVYKKGSVCQMSALIELNQTSQKHEIEKTSLLGKRQKLFEVEVVKNDCQLGPNKQEIDLPELKSEQPKVQKIAKICSDYAFDSKNELDDLLTAHIDDDKNEHATYENQKAILNILAEIKDNQLKLFKEQQKFENQSMLS